jgi:hypothetical protein
MLEDICFDSQVIYVINSRDKLARRYALTSCNLDAAHSAVEGRHNGRPFSVEARLFEIEHGGWQSSPNCGGAPPPLAGSSPRRNRIRHQRVIVTQRCPFEFGFALAYREIEGTRIELDERISALHSLPSEYTNALNRRRYFGLEFGLAL